MTNVGPLDNTFELGFGLVAGRDDELRPVAASALVGFYRNRDLDAAVEVVALADDPRRFAAEPLERGRSDP